MGPAAKFNLYSYQVVVTTRNVTEQIDPIAEDNETRMEPPPYLDTPITLRGFHDKR